MSTKNRPGGEERERCEPERVAGHDPQHHEEAARRRALSRIANRAGSPRPRVMRAPARPARSEPRRSPSAPARPPGRGRVRARRSRLAGRLTGSRLAAAREPQARRADQREHRAEDDAERQRPAAAGERGHDHRDARRAAARAEHARGREVGALHAAYRRRASGASGPSRPPSTPRDESMITRQGRSASTVSSVLPNSDFPVAARRQRHHQRARLDLARLLDDPPAGLARAHLLPVAGHAPPAAHARRVDQRRRARLLLGHRARRSASSAAR